MNKKGFTLIELLIVVAIIGIIAAIAIPNLLTSIQKSKQKATMGDMKSIGTAVTSYHTDMYIAPTTLTDAGFGGHIVFYMPRFPQRDGWGSAWIYNRGGTMFDRYSIRSYGRDQAATAPGVGSDYVVTSMAGFNQDIIFSDGTFAWSPRVK